MKKLFQTAIVILVFSLWSGCSLIMPNSTLPTPAVAAPSFSPELATNITPTLSPTQIFLPIVVNDITTLKDFATARNVNVGTLYNYAYSNTNYVDYQQYNEVITREFNTISLEWEFAMDEIWLDEYEYDYTYLDKVLQFASDHNLSVRGTHLLWHGTTPEWLENGEYSSEQVETMLRSYIENLFSHIQANFPGVMTDVNVVNEVIRDEYHPNTYGDLRPTFWVEKLGTGYIANVFQWAREAFPEAKLFINDYGIEFQDEKQQRFVNLLNQLQQDATPVDGVGLQAHFTIDQTGIYEDPFNSDQFAAVLEEYRQMGFEIQLTELDIRINDDQSGINNAKLDQQAQLYQQIFELCLANPAVRTITLWGFNNDLSYLNGNAWWLDQERDWGLIFNENYQPMPAYFSIIEALRQ